jgi:hypothetical protein
MNDKCIAFSLSFVNIVFVEKLAHIGQRMTLKSSSLIIMSAPNDEIFAQPFGLVDMSS